MPVRYQARVCQTVGSTASNEVSPLFLRYWQQHQEAVLLGTPISPPHYELNADGTGYTYVVQYLTNARLEWHEDLGDVRYNVELGMLGSEYLDSLWQTTGLACQ
jgi:hypothetical protein